MREMGAPGFSRRGGEGGVRIGGLIPSDLAPFLFQTVTAAVIDAM